MARSTLQPHILGKIAVKKTLLAAALLGLCAQGVAHAMLTGSTYSETISISDSHIHSSKNGQTIDLNLKQGALVVSAIPSAGFFGLKVGDTILKIDGKAVSSTKDFTEALDHSGATATFSVVRGRSQTEVVVQRHGGFDRFI